MQLLEQYFAVAKLQAAAHCTYVTHGGLELASQASQRII
jgi:hypothetical protein